MTPQPGITIAIPGIKYANLSTELVSDRSAVRFTFFDAKFQATVSTYVPPPMHTQDQDQGYSLIAEIALPRAGIAVAISSTESTLPP